MVTYLLRASFLLLPENVATPPLLRRALRYVPAAFGYDLRLDLFAQRAETQELLEGLRSLSADEARTLQDTAAKVVGRLADSLIGRLQPLAQRR